MDCMAWLHFPLVQLVPVCIGFLTILLSGLYGVPCYCGGGWACGVWGFAPEESRPVSLLALQKNPDLLSY